MYRDIKTELRKIAQEEEKRRERTRHRIEAVCFGLVFIGYIVMISVSIF